MTANDIESLADAQVLRTLLRALRVDLKVQQELLYHADIRTTMNIYTEAVAESLREANSQVARLVLQ